MSSLPVHAAWLKVLLHSSNEQEASAQKSHQFTNALRRTRNLLAEQIDKSTQSLNVLGEGAVPIADSPSSFSPIVAHSRSCQERGVFAVIVSMC